MDPRTEIIDPRDWPGGAPRHPALLANEDVDALLSRIRKGVPEEDACWSIGLNPSRFRKWMKEPAKGQRDEHPSIPEFRRCVMQTKALAVADLVEHVHECAPNEMEHPSITGKRIDSRWKMLERLRPEIFSPKATPSRLEVDVSHRIIDQREGQQIVSILEGAGLEIPSDVRSQLGIEVDDEIENV